MKKLEYYLFRFLYTIIGIVPFRILYPISDFLSFILHKVIRYRRDVVVNNLAICFPEKDPKEIKQITKRFYQNLCDVTLESIKGYSLSINKLQQRYRCLNPELANSYFEKGQSVIFALSHYANWEWGTQLANTYFDHDVVSFYKPLSNKYIDKYIKALRTSRGMTLCSIYQPKFNFRTEDMSPKAYFLVSDQNPSKSGKAYWLKFLNRDTACIHGMETYAQRFDLPIIYADVQRVERGKYNVVLKVLCDKPRDTQPSEITKRYMKNLENIITNKPEDWLWSHRRWKLKNPNEAIHLPTM